MRTKLILASLPWLIATIGTFAQDDAFVEKLRETARLPKMDLGMTMEYKDAFEKAGFELAVKTNTSALNGTDADGERYVEIAEAEKSLDHAEQAKEAFAAAKRIFERRLAANANDVRALVGLGRVLPTGTNHHEGERLLRRAIQIAPTNAQAWYELSSLIHYRCFQELGLTMRKTISGDDLADTVIRTANIDLIRKLKPVHAEGMRCADQAVRFAPDRAEFYNNRSSSRVFENLVDLRLSGKPVFQSNVLEAAWGPEVLADRQKAAELDPNNPDAVHSVLTWKMLGGGFRLPDFDWPRFQTNNQPFIDNIVGQLERISKNTNSLVAVTALRWIISIEFLQTNYARIVEACHEILRRDPSAEDARDSIIPALMVIDRFDDAVSEAEKRVRLSDTARNRLILALACESAKKWKDAEANVRKAVELEPGNTIVQLAFTVVLLKDGKAAEAREILERVKPDDEYAGPMAYVQGLYWAMKGSRFMARTQLERALDLDPGDRRATELLNLVNGQRVPFPK